MACIPFANNNLNMIRYLFIGLLAVCLSGSLQAKIAAPSKPTPSESSKSKASEVSEVISPAPPTTSSASSSQAKPHAAPGQRLARVTAYWAGEGDYYTGHDLSSTGIRLHDGHCAVDPNIIPYGSVVQIAGVGTYLAVDTGSAVVSRTAAREAAHNSEERNALVIDLYFESRRDGENFAANGPKYAAITWQAPSRVATQPKEIHSLLAQDNWSKTSIKQL